jgi:hypothetical protein
MPSGARPAPYPDLVEFCHPIGYVPVRPNSIAAIRLARPEASGLVYARSCEGREDGTRQHRWRLRRRTP